ncbi:MAG: hybrid sensor histidine kinase/response regulator [Alphaproteobacteria bacterium]|nr:hybrid sensor histidine kinase/response regulator [Alphaproteobacteria bacterium]
MDDLIVEFLTETNESLAAIDVQLVNLEQNPNDKNLLGSIFRLMHTIKGTCGFLGLPRLETVAHRAENVMGRFRDGSLEVTPDYVTLIFESIDRIKYIIGELEANGKEPDGADTDLIEKLDAVFEGRDLPQKSAAPAAEVPKPAAPVDPLQAIWDSIPAPADPIAAALSIPSQNDSKPAAPEAPAPVAAAPAAKPAEAPKASAKEEDHTAKESSVANQTLRVNVDVLENLMTLVSEMVLTRNQLLQIMRTSKESEFAAPLQRLNHVVSDLQEGVMKTRMQPIGAAWSKLPRIIRDLSHELGKKIELVMIGEETELDRQVLDLIKDPLTHMVRNSGDHGIEKPADRQMAGKPETGKIILRAFHEGGHIIIEIKDDGRGLNTARIKAKAIEKGIATADELANMTDKQIHQFIFDAGFSTAEKITSVSGRGVGMDVVRTNIEKIGGTIDLTSEEGKGSTFTIKIPLTLAIVSGLIVEAAGERYAIPQLSVQELVLASDKGDNRIEYINGTPIFRLRNHLLPLVSLQKLLKLPDAPSKVVAKNGNRGGNANNRYIVVTKVGGYVFGIIVDRVFDTEEIVVKPVAKMLSHIELFSGNTILGDGSVIMILDPGGIAKSTGEISVASAAKEEEEVDNRSRSGTKTSLLLFATGDSMPKAVPLSLVARLEDIDVTKIEASNGQMLIQYRGSLMPLIKFHPDMPMKKEGTQPTLVFSDGTRSMGLMVCDIIDIVEDYINVQITSDRPGFLGSSIIRGNATDIIDVGYYLKGAYKDWFKDHGDEDFDREDMKRLRRVLIVDDSPFFRNMLTPLLSVAGYEVTAAESPIRALEMQEAGEEFDIIISDIEMPEMSGFEFAQTVRNKPGCWKDTPMVALTSHATQNDIDRGREVGFSKYVAKFDRDTLLNTLSQTLAERKHSVAGGAA